MRVPVTFPVCRESAGDVSFTNNWTVRVEYDYVGLSNASFTVPAAFPVVGGDVFTTNNRNIQMVTVGVNYLFNGAPY